MTVHQVSPSSNPFRRLRAKEGISQYELAARAGVSKHAILRLEQGMYDKPLPTVLDYFLENFRVSEKDLLSDYSDFQIAVREENARLLGDIANLIDLPVGTHPLTFLREHAQLNLTELAKKLCISQTVVFNFENRAVTQHSVPSQLIHALHDADYTQEETDLLVNSYMEYRNHLIKTQGVKLVNVP